MAGIDPNVNSGLVDAAKEFVEASELAIIKAQRLRASAEKSHLQSPKCSSFLTDASDGKWTPSILMEYHLAKQQLMIMTVAIKYLIIAVDVSHCISSSN